jgi:hypothetical protein
MIDDLFAEGGSYTGPPVNDEMISHAECALGVRLPRSYVGALRIRNGGKLRLQCFPTKFPTSWAPDSFSVRALRGVGGTWGIDSDDGLGSDDLVEEWGYPRIGIVICVTPSGGHDAVMLDYSDCGSDGEPAVAYIDEDRVPRRVADTFEDFLNGLVACGDR